MSITLTALTAIGFFGLLGAYAKSAHQRLPKKTLLLAIIIVVMVVETLLFFKYQSWIESVDGRVFVVRAFSELALVYFIHLKPCKESAIIMVLSLLSVVINIIGYSATAFGINAYTLVSVNLLLIFYFMLAVLFSRNLSNGIYNNINRFAIVRGHCDNYLLINKKGAKS